MWVLSLTADSPANNSDDAILEKYELLKPL